MNKNLASRKRSSPLPNLVEQYDAKRERRLSSHGSETSTVSSSEGSSSKIRCRLCKNQVVFKNVEDFDFHLTMIHYREKLLDQLGDPPYHCVNCGFVPTAEDPNEEMILHYGCGEKFATKFYTDDCQKMLAPAKVKPDYEPNEKATKIICKICKRSCSSEKSFVLHITERHFSHKLQKKLPHSQPFKCPFKDCHQERSDKHSIMIHYGVDHNVTMELYIKHVEGEQAKSSPAAASSSPKKELKDVDMFNSSTKKPEVLKVDLFKASKQLQISCSFCKGKKMTFVTNKSLNYHLILNHFFTDLLRKNPPIACPKCNDKFPSKGEFTKHFIEKHFENYMKKKEYEKKSSSSGGNYSNKKENATTLPLNKSLNEEISKNDAPLPKSREMKTVHGPPPREMKTIHRQKSLKEMNTLQEVKPSSTMSQPSSGISGARQRLMDKWKSTSIDSQKFEMEQLSEKLESNEKEHKQAMSKKAQEFERWISQKEKVIEEEVEARRKVEDDLEKAQVDIADLKKQLEQKDMKINNLEEVLVQEHNRYSDLSKEKKDTEKKLATQEILGKELCEFQTYIEKMKSEGKEVKVELANKTEEVNELKEEIERINKDHEKQSNKLTKQLENLKSKHEKVMEDKKEKMANIKILTKENSELKKEIEAGNKKITKIKAEAEADEESAKAENESFKLLKSQREALLDSLDRVQKINLGFETVINDKNEKIQDLTTKLEEAEMNLSDAMEKLNTSKVNDKVKKENQKTIKQLQSTLKDWESRQFTNVKLISGLQSQNSTLEQKLKDFEEKVTVPDPDQIQQQSAKLKKLEKDIKTLRDSKEKLEQELARHQVLLSSKANELINVKVKKDRSENKVKELEKELRLAGSSNPNFSSTSISCRQDVDEDEIETLKYTISNLSERYAKLKAENAKLISGSSSGNLNQDSSKFLTTIDHLKRQLKTIQSKLYQKEKEIERLKKFGLIESSSSSTSSASTAKRGAISTNTNTSSFRVPNANATIKKEPEAEILHHQVVDTEERQIILDDVDIIDNGGGGRAGIGPSSSETPEPVDVEYVDSPMYNISSPSTDSRITNGSMNSPRSSTPGSIISNKKPISSSTTPSKKKKLVDVTDDYIEEEEDITCGICDCWDPPLINSENVDSGKPKKKSYTTSWVGCDCGQWYHKQCTNRKRFSAGFSCKSVKRKCQKAGRAQPEIPQPTGSRIIGSEIEMPALRSIDPHDLVSDCEPGEFILP